MSRLKPEIWRDIKGFEGYYKVSTSGKIKSVKNGKEKIRIPCAAPNGYLRLVLSANNKRKTVSIHRQVALAFLKNVNNAETVNHKDFNKQNNDVSNLEWMTISENIKHSCIHGGRCRKSVGQYNLNGNLFKVWESAYKVECELGYKATNISRCCRGNKKTYKNFKWSFYES